MEFQRILIADDQPHVLDALQLLLKNEGFIPETADSPAAVMEAVQHRRFDILLLDLNYARDTTSGGEGLELLARLREHDSSLPVVVMTAWGSIDLAVEAMQGGGRDFVQKPWDNEKLLSSLRRQIENGRILRDRQREIEEAREIQSRLIPEQPPTISGWEMQTFWQPLREVGGDYFDAIQLAGSKAGLCIADVGGKGIPAALLMSNMQASVRGLAASTSSPAEMCRRLNRFVLENTRADRLTSFFYGILDPGRGTLRYSNAGHVPPFLLRADGSIARLCEGGMIFGVSANEDYEGSEIDLGIGDTLILITDGITEATNIRDEDFGEDRLIEILRENAHRSAADIHREVLRAVRSFALNGFRDDATLVTIRCTRAVSVEQE